MASTVMIRLRKGAEFLDSLITVSYAMRLNPLVQRRLYQPCDTDEYGAVDVMIICRERLKFLKKYLPQCHLVHHKSA
jgi:hypothetical protein